MNRTNVNSVLSLALAMTALAWTRPSVAQTAGATAAGPDNGGSSGLQEIVVTAEKREQSIQDVPAAISALDAREIWTCGIQG